MYRCIYCLRLLPESQFNREHVLPQHLGRFHENFVLHNSVCEECNDSLGKQLETWLGRNSYEALLRLRFGQKPLSELDEFHGRGVAIRIPPGSQWAGALLRLIADLSTDELKVDLRPQVGVKRPADTEFRFFTDEEFRKAPDEQIGREKGSTFKIVGLGQSGSDEVINMVRARIPGFKIDGSMPSPPSGVDGEITVAITAAVHALLTRSIAKIAFNYLSYISGAEFVLDPTFNEVRRFIRYGEGNWRTFVSARAEPIVVNDHIWYGSIRAHLITLDWPERGETIDSSVSLFNETMYDIRLGRPAQLWRPVRSGHAFFWETGEIKGLVSSTLSIPWQTGRI